MRPSILKFVFFLFHMNASPIDQVSSEHTNQIVAIEAPTYLGRFYATCDKTQ